MFLAHIFHRYIQFLDKVVLLNEMIDMNHVYSQWVNNYVSIFLLN
jgi:hypothetical protein